MGSLGARRMVFFAGLPGTGKSLLLHQLALLAAAAGRRVHLLQWDVARPVFEATPAGRPYPLVEGVTHPAIRRAAGLWVREAVAAWDARHPSPEHLLLGETPLIGGRFIELARRLEDRAEPLLSAPGCRFVVTAPSAEVRRFLENERERRAENPLHPGEREDAPPRMLQDLWEELGQVARRLGVTGSGGDYDPAVYRRVYETVLRHRNVAAVPLGVILGTGTLSVYEFAVDLPRMVPSPAEAEAFIRAVEARYPDAALLEREAARWWEV